jgi:tRNA pseudouridine38-40 synthase
LTIDTNTFALGIAYQGTRYHGWQYQSESTPTIQLSLQTALSVVADEPLQVICAGRTDTGVHATKQVVHLHTSKQRSERAWVMGTNAHLPDDVSVVWARSVANDFSARYSAVARRYCYVIYSSPVRSALLRGMYTRDPRRLDAEAMHEAGQALVGEHNFTSFRASSCQSLSPKRNVHHLKVTRRGELIVIDIEANAFLHHMVRNIAGVLLDIGAGAYPGTWVPELLSLRDRTKGSMTAPPDGLYMVDVKYPGVPEIPLGPGLPHFLEGLL